MPKAQTDSQANKTKTVSESQLTSAREVIQAEINALENLNKNLDSSFNEAIDLILKTKGRVVVTGMGKSGHIAGKIAATLASTGTPSFFVHPAELAHGDFGMLTEDDLVIAISNSGETNEVTNTLLPIKRRGLVIIAITSNASSTLATHSNVVLNLGAQEEACPLNLAPTTSTTATLALGDALAIVLMKEKNFSQEDFAKFHPGGNLGKRLIKVTELMRKNPDEIPLVAEDTEYAKILQEISDKKLGFTCVISNSGALNGMITDGDLRRAQINFASETYSKKAHEVMNSKPKVIAANALAVEALHLMETQRIAALVIVDVSNKPVGVLDLKDLIKAGVY